MGNNRRVEIVCWPVARNCATTPSGGALLRRRLDLIGISDRQPVTSDHHTATSSASGSVTGAGNDRIARAGGGVGYTRRNDAVVANSPIAVAGAKDGACRRM
jgi:hypothetical protein